MNNRIRIWRSPDSAFLPPEDNPENGKETLCACETYTDKVFSGIVDNGFNAIWIHAIFNDMACVEPFPELGKNSAKHLAAVNKLIAAAARFGVKVYLYMQPPRAVPLDNHEFWDAHGDIGGSVSKKHRTQAMCVSADAVRLWLRNASRKLAESLPGLGGVILITASELPSHCYGHWQKYDKRYLCPCPRCIKREPQDIVVDILNNVRDGIRDSGSGMDIIVWNWSWSMWGLKSPCAEIIGRIPRDIVLMADFERGGRKDLWKRPDSYIDEYCLTYDGPSQYCLETFALARSLGMETMAKLQFGTTHEAASVVSIPVMNNIFRKADFMRKTNNAGFMGCWNFGNFFSANTAGFNYFLGADAPADETRALVEFAKSYFPGSDADKTAAAWRVFTDSMSFYPFCIPFIYRGPMNFSLVYAEIFKPGALKGTDIGPSHLWAERGDDLSQAITPEFSLESIIERMERLSGAWRGGLAIFRDALSPMETEHAKLEYGNAATVGGIWRSTANSFKAYSLRLDWTPERLPELKKLALDELENLREVIPFVRADKRLGWHAEAHAYLFSEKEIMDKIAFLEKLVSGEIVSAD